MIGRAFEAITEQIRQASDIVDVVGSYVSLRRAGRVMKGLCPFHSEKTPSFHVNPEKQIFKCFGCGAGGDVFKFVQRRENVSFVEAKAILAARAGISLEDEAPRGRDGGVTKAELDRVNRWALLWFQKQLTSPNGTKAREYALSRGFSEDSIAQFEIGFGPDSWDALTLAAGRQRIPVAFLLAAGLVKPRSDGTPGHYDAFRNRLIFPIRDAMNRVIGFGGRTLGDDPAKYINSPQNALFDKSRCLFGISLAKNAFGTGRQAVVVEGYTDCLLLQQAGFGQVVATLGTAMTTEHVAMLRRYVDGVTLVFDSDEAGQRAADRALDVALIGDLEVRLARVPTGKDPADFVLAQGAEAFDRVLTSAVGALEFKWNQVLAHRRTGTGGAAEHRAIEEFMGLVARSGSVNSADPIRKGLIVNQIGKILGLPADEVYRNLMLASRRANARTEGEPESVPSVQRRSDGGAASIATRQLLEVLLNEPSYFDSVSAHFEPGLLSDELDATIARAFVDYVGRADAFILSEFLSCFDSVEAGQRVVDLHDAGESRGNFGGTVEGAVTCLERIRLQAQAGELLATVRRSLASSVGAEDSSDDAIASSTGGVDSAVFHAAQDAAKRAGHFAARRHVSAGRLASPMADDSSA